MLPACAIPVLLEVRWVEQMTLRAGPRIEDAQAGSMCYESGASPDLVLHDHFEVVQFVEQVLVVQ